MGQGSKAGFKAVNNEPRWYFGSILVVLWYSYLVRLHFVEGLNNELCDLAPGPTKNIHEYLGYGRDGDGVRSCTCQKTRKDLEGWQFWKKGRIGDLVKLNEFAFAEYFRFVLLVTSHGLGNGNAEIGLFFVSQASPTVSPNNNNNNANANVKSPRPDKRTETNTQILYIIS